MRPQVAMGLAEFFQLRERDAQIPIEPSWQRAGPGAGQELLKSADRDGQAGIAAEEGVRVYRLDAAVCMNSSSEIFWS
jgi:hypothetical protein